MARRRAPECCTTGLVGAAWFDLLGEPCGSHLHDVDGCKTTRTRRGAVDFAWLARRLPATAARTFEINQREPDEALRNAIVRLREAGVIEGP